MSTELGDACEVGVSGSDLRLVALDGTQLVERSGRSLGGHMGSLPPIADLRRGSLRLPRYPLAVPLLDAESAEAQTVGP